MKAFIRLKIQGKQSNSEVRKIINIKIGRVGGLTEAKKIHDYCMEKNIPVWCGGMLESGIGRAHNVALTTLPNFILPGDTAGSSRYWEEDIIHQKSLWKTAILPFHQAMELVTSQILKQWINYTVEYTQFKA